MIRPDRLVRPGAFATLRRPTEATHVRRELTLNRTRKLLAACAVALAAPALIAGCGDDGGDEDPAELLRTALSQDTEYESGVVNVGLEGSLEGVTSGSINADISGPFSSGGEAQVPELGALLRENRREPGGDEHRDGQEGEELAVAGAHCVPVPAPPF